jgi:hypothetical protein
MILRAEDKKPLCVLLIVVGGFLAGLLTLFYIIATDL